MNKTTYFLKRSMTATLLVAVLLGAAGAAEAGSSKDHKAFAALSARLSETGGYFDSDNLISNETSYQHVLGKIRENQVSGGVYIGVGPDQNFTYIAKIRPRMAIITDIRRDNLLQHLLFKSLFERARNRVEYLCLFFGKPFPKTRGWESRGVREIVEYIDGTPSDAKLFEKTVKGMRQDVQKFGIMLSESDLETVERIHRAFYSAGLEIRYSSYHRPPRSIYPSYRELLLQQDLDGNLSNYFNSEDDFQYLKKMQAEDRIVPVMCDLSGPKALKAVGQYLAEIREKVSAMYVSNVEFYLVRQGTFDRFVDNLKTLPIDGRSMIIRSYFNYYAPSHPQAIGDHYSTQSVTADRRPLKDVLFGRLRQLQRHSDEKLDPAQVRLRRSRAAVEDIYISSWSDLNEQLYEGSWKETLGRHRSNFVYRGLSQSSFNLRSSLSRLAGTSERIEGHLLRNFRKYARRDAVPDDSVWNWLALAQHHGLPTRLIDFTYSPLVAAHFATVNLASYDHDAAIWCVDFVKSNQLLPEKLRTILLDEGSDAFTVEMLRSVAGTLAEFDRLWGEEFVIFLEPPSLDDRIVNQFALFSMMSSQTSRLDNWLQQHPELYRRVIIPAGLKWEIRDKLDQANITERVMMPGLDGLSSWLKRYYTLKTM